MKKFQVLILVDNYFMIIFLKLRPFLYKLLFKRNKANITSTYTGMKHNITKN
jgi:hypothetical protein